MGKKVTCPNCSSEFEVIPRAKRVHVNRKLPYNCRSAKFSTGCYNIPVAEVVVERHPNLGEKFSPLAVEYYCIECLEMLKKMEKSPVVYYRMVDTSNLTRCVDCPNFERVDDDWIDGKCKLNGSKIEHACKTCICDKGDGKR